ncbi:MAG: hypothetical protein ACRC1G_12015 [Bradyrhizobium sp.]
MSNTLQYRTMGTFVCAAALSIGVHTTRNVIMMKTFTAAAMLCLSTSLAVAQAGGNTAGGSSQSGGPAASKTTTGDSMDGRTTGGRDSKMMKDGARGTTGMSTSGSSAPSSSGNVGPGTNNNSGPQSGGR